MNASKALEGLWNGDSLSARAGRALLLPAASLYASATRLRSALYADERLPSFAVDTPVVSVGSIRVGGAGKTPFVLWLVETLLRRGTRVVTVTSGYGGSEAGPTVIVPDGSGDPSLVERVGDEAVLLARRLHAPVVAGRDRVAACHLASRLGCDLIVVDDGFQHLRLRRDLDLVLVGGDEASLATLPAGPLREPPAALARADLRVFTGGDGPRPDDCAFSMRRRPLAWVQTVDREARKEALDSLAGRPALAVAALARSERFFADVEACGVDVVGRLDFRDHHRYGAADWTRIREAAGPGAVVVTTEKDLVKLESLADGASDLYALRLGVEVDDEVALLERLGRV